MSKSKLQQQIIEVDITSIKENPNNPRLIDEEDFEKLKKSIQGFPEMLYIRPIVVDSNNVVLGGNQRLKACLELKMKKVPIIQTKNLTDSQLKEFLIKDNLQSGFWDWEKLEADFSEIDLNNWGLIIPESHPEYSQDDLDRLS